MISSSTPKGFHTGSFLLTGLCFTLQPRMTRINPLGKDKGRGKWEPKGLNSDKAIEQLEAVSATVSWEAWLYRETALVQILIEWKYTAQS